MQFLGIIYAWTGEKDLAIKQIAATLQVAERAKLRRTTSASFLGSAAGRSAF